MTHDPLSDLEGDIRDHLARETQEHMQRGLSAEDARYAALRRFGSVTLAMENTRAVWVSIGLDQCRQDVRYAYRMLRRQPGFTSVAILTLALGIGLTTGVYSVVHAVLIRPLPYADSQRLVVVRETQGDLTGNASAGHFSDWSEQATVFDATAALRATTYTLADSGDPERVSGMRVTPDYFRVAYLEPAIGRYFDHGEVDGGARVVVLSHGLWRRRFSGDRTIVGRAIRLNGEPFTVIGVAPAAFALTDPARAGVAGGFSAQLWTPLAASPEQRTNYGNHSLLVLAKLKPGTTLAQAQADVERVTRGIAARHPREMEGRGVKVQPLHEVLVGSVRTQLLVLFAAVGLVLVIGCVNIGSLLVARATTRGREIGIRAALGGGRARIVRQLLTESLTLALAGGLAGLIVAFVAVQFLVNSGPAAVPRLGEAGLHLPVLGVGLAITLLAAAMCGLAPAVRAARTDLQSSLRGGGRTSTMGGTRDRVRTLMVVGQIAIAVVLLVGVGLLARSAQQLRQVPLGFNAHDVLTARVALPAGPYQAASLVSATYGRMLDQLRLVRGVSRAGASTTIPLGSNNIDAVFTARGQVGPPGAGPSPQVRMVTEDYLEAIGMTIVRGRSLQSADMVSGAAPAVVVNQRLAAALWPNADPIGQRLSGWTAGPDPEWREVVGVAGDVRTFGQRTPVPAEVFLPYTQAPTGAWDAFQRSMVLVVRTAEDWPETYIPRMRMAVSAVDPSIPLFDVNTMEDVVVASTASRRFTLRLVLWLAATGLVLATIGLYGVISYFVTQRTSEIGLRLALGAERRQVMQMVVAHGLGLAVAGTLVGIVAAVGLTRLMSSLLYEITPTDALTYAGVAALLTVATLLASWIPASSAARVDPLAALRHE